MRQRENVQCHRAVDRLVENAEAQVRSAERLDPVKPIDSA